MKIRISHYTYTIEFVNNPAKKGGLGGEDIVGCCNNMTQSIYIKKGIAPELIRDTLLHEILHAIWFVMGLNDLDPKAEEMHVAILAPSLTQVLMSNKKLRKYFDD